MEQTFNGRILCGTSGYDYPEWRGVFYPEDLPRGEFLAYYASRFPALEINSTFYRMPSETNMRSMLNRSGGRLFFSVKAPQLFTHGTGAGWQTAAAEFRAAILPLANSGMLSAVLFQFPQSFHYEPDNRIYLNNLLAAFSGCPSVVEFRHAAWFTERVYEGLDRRGTGIVVCDMPRLSALPPPVPVVTGGRAYIRFHGRNSGSWYAQTEQGDGKAENDNGKKRYAYTYTEKELAAEVPLIVKLTAKGKMTHVFFNNHPDGAAAINAGRMRELTECLPS